MILSGVNSLFLNICSRFFEKSTCFASPLTKLCFYCFLQQFLVHSNFVGIEIEFFFQNINQFSIIVRILLKIHLHLFNTFVYYDCFRKAQFIVPPILESAMYDKLVENKEKQDISTLKYHSPTEKTAHYHEWHKSQFEFISIFRCYLPLQSSFRNITTSLICSGKRPNSRRLWFFFLEVCFHK